MKSLNHCCLKGEKGCDLPHGVSINGDPIPKNTEITG